MMAAQSRQVVRAVYQRGGMKTEPEKAVRPVQRP